MNEVNPPELKAELDAGAAPQIVDVRDEEELTHSHLEGAKVIPLAELLHRLDELDKEADTVVICRTGNRSGQAAMLMGMRGFSKVRNLAGGMNAWVKQVDSSMETY